MGDARRMRSVKAVDGGVIARIVCLLLVQACVLHVPRGTVPVEQARALPRVVTQLDPAAPRLYLEASVRAGSAFDPIGKEGLAALTARAMVEGVREAVDGTGGEIGLVVGKELVSFRLACVREQAGPCLELFGDLLTAPDFEPAVVGELTERAAWRTGGGAAEDEAALADAVLDRVLFQGHPYGHPVDGLLGVVGLLGVDEVREFYQGHYLRQQTVLGVGGAFEAEQVEQVVLKMAGLGDGLPPERSTLAPLVVAGRSLWSVPTGSEVVELRLGHPLAVNRAHEDQAGVLLGLVALTRPERVLSAPGLARHDAHLGLRLGPLSVQEAPEALAVALTGLERLVSGGLTEQELVTGRQGLVAAVSQRAADPAQRLASAVEAAAMGWPDPLDSLPGQLAALTLEEVSGACRRHLHPDDLQVVAVGAEVDALTVDERRLIAYEQLFR
jgi:zinc protease